MSGGIFLLALLGTALASAAPTPVRHAQAFVKVERSYISWRAPRGEILTETICEREIAVPVYDLRARPDLRGEAEPAEMSCASKYLELNVAVNVRGMLQLIGADDFKLPLPRGEIVKRTLFTLTVDGGAAFPHYGDLQNLAGWQLFTEDLSLRSQIFSLSPEAFLKIVCGGAHCVAPGPQAVYRAQVRLLDPL